MVDYTREDLTPSGETYDVIFDTVGNLSESQGKRVLKADGIYLKVHKSSGNGEKLADLLAIKGLIEARKFKPVIDRCYPLEQIVEAHR